MSVASFIKNMFSFSGRASRSGYWLAIIVLVALSFPVMIVFTAIDTVLPANIVKQSYHISPLAYVFLAVYVAALTPVTVRRMHDINKSGTVVVFPAVAISGTYVIFGLDTVVPILPDGQLPALHAFVVLLSFIACIIILFRIFIRGTVGPNSYGPDPLEKTDNAAPKPHINENPSEESTDSPPPPTSPSNGKGALITASTVVFSIIAIIFTMAYYGDKKKDIEKLPKFNEHTATDSLTALGKTQDDRPLSPVFKSSNVMREDYPSNGASEFRRAAQDKKSITQLNTPSRPPISVSASESFYKLCESGTAAEIKKAIQNGAKINKTDSGGDTCLTWAAAFNSPEAVQTILDAGADLTIVGKDGMSPMALAALVNRNKEVSVVIANAEAQKNRWKEGGSEEHKQIEAFLKGDVKTFKSKGHPNSLGVNFEMDYPKYLIHEEARMPGVLAKFVNKDEAWDFMVIMEVVDFPNAKNISRNNLINMLSDDSADKIFDKDEYIKIKYGKYTSINTNPSRIFYGTMKRESPIGYVDVETIILHIIYGDKVIQIYFPYNEVTLSKDFNIEKKYDPKDRESAILAMINSIEFPDQWKK